MIAALIIIAVAGLWTLHLNDKVNGLEKRVSHLERKGDV